jgi:adenylate kinase
LFKVLDDVIRNRQGPVILDGHYAHDYKPKIDDAIVFVLRRAPWVLYEELEERGYAMKKVWENIESEIMGICSNEARENHDIVCEIDTTKLSLKEITANIQRIIEEKDSCPTEQIDWLTCSRTIDLMKEGR